MEEASKIMLLDGSPQAQELAPTLTTVELSDERHKELQSELARWYERGGHYAVDEPGAMIMASLFSHLGHAALADDGVEYPEIRLMGKLISEPQNPLWDDKNTPEVEDAAQIMRRAYAETDAELTARLGRDHTTWRWGDLHVQTPRSWEARACPGSSGTTSAGNHGRSAVGPIFPTQTATTRASRTTDRSTTK